MTVAVRKTHDLQLFTDDVEVFSVFAVQINADYTDTKAIFFRFCCKTDGIFTAIMLTSSGMSVQQGKTGTFFTYKMKEIRNVSVKQG